MDLEELLGHINRGHFELNTKVVTQDGRGYRREIMSAGYDQREKTIVIVLGPSD